MLTFTIYSIGPSLLNVLLTFLMYIGLSIFFNLNLIFFANSELITSPITTLSNSTSTITPSCISILLSSLIILLHLFFLLLLVFIYFLSSSSFLLSPPLKLSSHLSCLQISVRSRILACITQVASTLNLL